MHNNGARLLVFGLLCCLLTSCTLPGFSSTPTILKVATPTLLKPSPAPSSPTALLASSPTAATFPTLLAPTAAGPTQISATQAPASVTQVPSATFCADAQVTTLINSLKSALQSSNGTLLASLVSPTHGMDARLYRNGRIVNYDQQHAKFLFQTTFVVNWGAAPGSGLDTMGSFHERIVPDLLDVFNKNYTLTCNQVQIGGASYQAVWPYTGYNFYSVYYPGSQANNSLDWHTWLLGMHYVNGRPYLYAIMQFKWEP